MNMLKSLSIAGLLLLSFARGFADDTNAAPTPAATTPPPVPAAAAPAAPTGPVLAPTNDSGLGNDGTILDQDSYQARIGEFHAPGGECYIMPLRLPTIPDGQKIATIHFRGQLVSIASEATGLGNADLYALGVRDTNKILPTDYYQGPNVDSKATMIESHFLTPASKVRTAADTGPFIETTPAADAALAKVINDACAKPGSTGKFLFLRVSYDVDPIPDGNNAYMLLTTGATGDNEPPLFTYTLAPK